MSKGRLEAFSDGVIAIIITIMVLELRPPEEGSLHSLLSLAPVFTSYLLSFVYLGIYWNNHRHMLQRVTRITGPVLWANLHLLFWLSLTPFATAWLGETHFAAFPTMVYGVLLFMSGLAYFILATVLLKVEGPESKFARAMGKGTKEWWSIGLYAVAIVAAQSLPVVSHAVFGLVALLWLVPDRRFEHA